VHVASFVLALLTGNGEIKHEKKSEHVLLFVALTTNEVTIK